MINECKIKTIDLIKITLKGLERFNKVNSKKIKHLQHGYKTWETIIGT